MEQLLCRNNYDEWRGTFDGDKAAHFEAGLMLAKIGRDSEDHNTVWFLFDVADRTMADAFITAPEASKQAEKSGVIDGKYRFITSETTY